MAVSVSGGLSFSLTPLLIPTVHRGHSTLMNGIPRISYLKVAETDPEKDSWAKLKLLNQLHLIVMCAQHPHCNKQ